MVKTIRKELLNDNDRPKYDDYVGLCDAVWEKLEKKINEHNNSYIMKEMFKGQLIPFQLHGEMRHTSKINPDNWGYQHTWYAVIWKQNNYNEYSIPPSYKEIIYIDPTSQQFQWLFTDIPNYYISTIPPKWYYWDSLNPTFIGIRRWFINRNKSNIKILLKEENVKSQNRYYRNYMRFIQHVIKRNLCKVYRWIIGRKEEGY